MPVRTERAPETQRTVIVCVISSWSVQMILYVPGTVSLRR